MAARRRHSARRAEENLRGWLVLVGLVVAIALVRATDGLILIAPLMGGIAWVLLRIRSDQKKRANVLAAEQRAALAEQQRHLESVTRAQEMGQLLVLSPTEFEHAVQDILVALGFRLQHRGGVGDRGIDLEGVDAYGRPLLVQCKQYGPHRRIGGPEIRNFLGSLWQHGTPAGMFVTTATFTGEAWAAAQDKAVQLVDGDGLIALARTAAAQVAHGHNR